MKYRKKQIVFDAVQWFKNGDHPEDKSDMVYPDPNSTTQFHPFLSEGKVVPHFNYSSDFGNEFCEEVEK